MAKTFTSASANKLLRRLEDEKNQLLMREQETSTYVLAQGEEPEAPAYDYAATREGVAQIDAKVCAIRHAMHAFNMATKLPESDLTIDEALVVLAQLSAEQRRLDTMRSRLPRQRLTNTYSRQEGSGALLVEYEYANYDIAQAEQDYQKLTDRIYDLQLKLDLCNQTMTFEVDV